MNAALSRAVHLLLGTVHTDQSMAITAVKNRHGNKCSVHPVTNKLN